MTLGFRGRFLAAMILLRASAFAAGFGRRRARGLPAPTTPAFLPRADPDPEERAERLASPLALVPIAQKFGLDDGFDHWTPGTVPPDHRYPREMRLAKALLMAGLAVDLRDAPVPAPSTGRWLGMPLSRRLGWDGPERFAALRTQGPNAGWLRRDGDRYTADLRILRDLPVRPGRSLAPCLAVFDLDLRPQGIEVGGRWVPAGDPGWDRARQAFQCADLHVHEAVSHFLWTHVLGEKLLVATLRRLDRDHPVRRLLEPHFAGTLQANENSGARLLGPDGLFERCFSAGWTGVAELLRRGAAEWRYERMILPRDLADRGVLELPNYPYRDDGLLLWVAVERYVGAVVDAWYPNEVVVLADPELARWAGEIRGWLPSFPDLRDRSLLKEALTGTLFVVVQHTLVNALQYDAFGDPAVWPASLGSDGRLPEGVEAIDTARATFGFSIQYNTLGDNLVAWHPERTRPAAERFLVDLQAARRTIEAREVGRAWPYRIARPDRLSNSINA